MKLVNMVQILVDLRNLKCCHIKIKTNKKGFFQKLFDG